MRVLGVSPDTVQDQAAFRAKHDLPFSLLADEDHALAGACGVWVLKTRPNGEEYYGVQRSTFIIGPDGVVTHAFLQVVPAEHSKELLQALQAI